MHETFARYEKLRIEYDAEEDTEDDPYALMPPVADADALASLIRPIRLHLHLRMAEGTPYVGIETQPQWDQEHGLGLLFQGDRLVEFAAAEMAWQTFVVDRDLASGGNSAPIWP